MTSNLTESYFRPDFRNDRYNPLRIWRVKPKEIPVTLIVGIVCKDSAIIACESQYTYGTRKDLDAEKTSVIHFKKGGALVAESGFTDVSGRTVQFMREIAKDRELDNPWAIADVAEEAVKRMRKFILESLCCETRSVEETQMFFNGEQFRFDLMLAQMHDDTPYLYTLDSRRGVVTARPRYGIIGCGDDIADFIFKDLNFKNISWKEAIAMSIYAIEKVKDRDTACGGLTRLTTMDANRIVPMPFTLMNKLTGKLKALSEAAKNKLREDIQAVIDQTAKEVDEEAIRQLEAGYNESAEPTK
jgi:20S proteasome alpha/beta subunit